MDIIENMDFSSIALCADNKRRINFQSFPISAGGLIHQTSNMGVHRAEEIPFVKLTGHKIEESYVHPTFEMSELARGFGLAEKLHSLASNTKNFMKGDNFLPRKMMYGSSFSAFAFSPLVGGFVGSKSQVGSSSRESCQIWDVIIDKLTEFCGASQSDYPSVFSNKQSQHYCNLESNLSQEILEQLCQKNVSTLGGPHVILENAANIIKGKVMEANSNINLSSQSSKHPENSVTSTGITDVSPSISKQSYAEVARNFAITQQNKKHHTDMLTTPKRSASRGRMPKPNPRHRNLCVDSWRQNRNPSMEYSHKYNSPPSYRNQRHYRPNSTENKTERNTRHKNSRHSTFQRAENWRDRPQTICNTSVTKYNKECVNSQVDSNSSVNKFSSMRQDKPSVKTCMSTSSSAPSVDEPDKCAVFPHELVQEVHASSSKWGNCASTPDSSPRRRVSSECSTDSDDSFVIFDSGVDCDSVTIVALMRAPSIADSDLSEDGIVYQFSDDEDTEDEEDTETVVGLEEVNARWQRDYSDCSDCEKNPAKVQFARGSNLKMVHPMVAWNHAYRAARCGPWEQMARDRERFKYRVKQMEPVLAPILSSEHRSKVWNRRMSKLHCQVT